MRALTSDKSSTKIPGIRFLTRIRVNRIRTRVSGQEKSIPLSEANIKLLCAELDDRLKKSPHFKDLSSRLIYGDMYAYVSADPKSYEKSAFPIVKRPPVGIFSDSM